MIGQDISGYVFNINNEPVPFVNIYVKELKTGTSTDPEGRYYLTLETGDYEIVFSSIGYQTKIIKVIIRDQTLTKNIWLESSSVELDEIIVRAGKKDPAYEIIKKVIDNKKRNLSQVKSSRSNVYIKATEKLNDKKRKHKAENEESEKLSADGVPLDPFEEELKQKEILMSKLNMVEIQLLLNYQYPDQYKEERTGYKIYGDKSGLFIPNLGDTDFNFYHNLVDLKGISETPIISPLSRTAILTYKYKLEDISSENGLLVYKIKVIPRKTGNSNCKGYIFVNDSLWNINRLDLTIHKGGLIFFDDFRVKQNYTQIENNIWVPLRQEFYYEIKQGRFKTYKGNTVIKYSDYQRDYNFPHKFFGPFLRPHLPG